MLNAGVAEIARISDVEGPDQSQSGAGGGIDRSITGDEWFGRTAFFEAETTRIELGRRFVLRLTYAIFGLLAMTLGFVLIVLGYAGVVDFGFAAGPALNVKLSNASPGLVLASFGLIAIWIAAVSFAIKSRMSAAGQHGASSVGLSADMETMRAFERPRA